MSFRSMRLLIAGATPVLACVCVPALAEDLTPNLAMNGYITAGMAWLNNANGATYPKNINNGVTTIQTDPTAEYDSVAGIQFKYRINDQTDAVTQFVAAGQNTQQDNYSVRTEWAYLDYHFNDDFTLRAGRFAFSTYMYSENLRVGEAYPWARLPTEIYSQLGGLYSLNGVEVLYRHQFGDWNLTLQPNAGDEQLNGFAVNNSTQVAANLSNDNLTLHVGTGRATLNITQPGTISQIEPPYGITAGSPEDAALQAAVNKRHDPGSFSDAGFIYDDGKWFSAGEAAELRVGDYPTDFNAYYLSVGHYFGKWLPYVLYSYTKTVNNSEGNPNTGYAVVDLAINQQVLPTQHYQEATASIGARYQLKSNVSLKMQADRIGDMGGTSGLFNLSTTNPQPVKTAYLYSLSISAAY